MLCLGAPGLWTPCCGSSGVRGLTAAQFFVQTLNMKLMSGHEVRFISYIEPNQQQSGTSYLVPCSQRIMIFNKTR